MININEPFFSEQGVSDVMHTIESKQWAAGKNIEKLEESMRFITGKTHAVAVCNATAALELAIQSLNPHRGAEIITPSFTYRSAITAILRAGCIPVFADVGNDYNIDLFSARKLLNKDTVAIIGTDMFGYPCEAGHLSEFANSAGIDFIQDSSQAIGAKLLGHHVGNLADVVVFSFYSTKNVGMGEGGILLTDDFLLYKRAKSMREATIDTWSTTMYQNIVVGTNLRMSEILAPLAIDGIKNLSNISSTRRRNASRLIALLDIAHPHFSERALSSWNTFPILHDDRDGLIRHLEVNEIQAKVYYDYLINYDPIYQAKYPWQPTPNALEISKKIVSLPIHHNLNDIHMQAIAEGVKSYEPAAPQRVRNVSKKKQTDIDKEHDN